MAKHSNFRRRGGGPDRRPGRRVPPPDHTGQYRGYLAACRESETPVTLHLADGTSCTGTLGPCDENVISLRTEGATLQVQSSAVRYIEGR